MSELLDDHNFEDKNIEKNLTPNKKIGTLGIFIFVVLLSYQIWIGATSETALVLGSYYWMPFLVFGIFGFIVRPKIALLLGGLTILVMFIFYELIWQIL